jgi:hypothetical protein
MALGTPCLSTAPTVPDYEGEVRVILDEDPACEIVWPQDKDKDNEPEVSGEGLGEEGGFNMGEEGENEEDPELGDEGMTHAKPACPLPMWLKEDFEQKVGESKI